MFMMYNYSHFTTVGQGNVFSHACLFQLILVVNRHTYMTKTLPFLV